MVNFNGAKGKLTAHVISPSGTQEEALVQEVDDGEILYQNLINSHHKQFPEVDVGKLFKQFPGS